MSHINIIKGDYIFYAWKDGEDERLYNTIKELESKGFVFKGSEVGFQDMYSYYEDSKGNEIVITECLL